MAPCQLQFRAEKVLPERAKALFPRQDAAAYADAMAAIEVEMTRAKSSIRDPKTGHVVFAELVRRRESIFRFGEVRTSLAEDPHTLAEALFARYVRMEAPNLQTPALIGG